MISCNSGKLKKRRKQAMDFTLNAAVCLNINHPQKLCDVVPGV